MGDNLFWLSLFPSAFLIVYMVIVVIAIKHYQGILEGLSNKWSLFYLRILGILIAIMHSTLGLKHTQYKPIG